jgi:hypothetical protein
VRFEGARNGWTRRCTHARPLARRRRPTEGSLSPPRVSRCAPTPAQRPGPPIWIGSW